MIMMKTYPAAAEQDFRNAVSDVEDLLDNSGERARSAVRDVQDRALRVLDDARERLA
jgi:ElaB/YqjD/DUF883 family membrane-anchored ribosome-binding protein